MDNLYERITTWNRDRNQTTFDPKLETKMLSEEASEFWEATDLAHVLQEYSDFRFVMVGTRYKYFAQRYDSADSLLDHHSDWQELESWMNACMDIMRTRCQRKLKDHGINPPTDIFTKSLKYVVEANEAKGTEKVGGKVVKGDTYVSPLERIQTELNFLLKR